MEGQVRVTEDHRIGVWEPIAHPLEPVDRGAGVMDDTDAHACAFDYRDV